jgi:uncharacterized protein (DUF362 family)
MLKGQFHVKMGDPYNFATMLVDINTFIKPRLFIMDGIMAMEGNGPRNGISRALNVLLCSSDPVAIDAIACKIINLSPEFVPITRRRSRIPLTLSLSKGVESGSLSKDPRLASNVSQVGMKTGFLLFCPSSE